MVSGETLALAAGGLLASEATGATDFTAIGRGGGGGGGDPTPPTGLPPGLAAILAGSGGEGPSLPPGLFQLFEDQQATVRGLTEQIGQGGRGDIQIEVPAGPAGPGGGGAAPPWEGWEPPDIPTPEPPDVPTTPPWEGWEPPDVPTGPGGGPTDTGGGDGGDDTPGFFEGVTGMKAPDPAGWIVDQGAQTVGDPSKAGDPEAGGAIGFAAGAGQAVGGAFDTITGGLSDLGTGEIGPGTAGGTVDATLFGPGIATAMDVAGPTAPSERAGPEDVVTATEPGIDVASDALRGGAGLADTFLEQAAADRENTTDESAGTSEVEPATDQSEPEKTDRETAPNVDIGPVDSGGESGLVQEIEATGGDFGDPGFGL